jgi:hypothetical protein
MTSSGETKTNYARRFMWFALAIVVVIAAYTGAWHYAASFLGDRFNASIASLNREGRRANCEDAEVRGYPFRIGIFCNSVMYENAAAGVGFRARAFRSASQVYAPHRALGELDGPATLEIPGLAALDLHWDSMRASARLATPLPERVSVESRALTVRIDEPGDVSPLLMAAEIFEVHLRPAGNDLDLANRFTRLQVAPELLPLENAPLFNGLVDFQLTDGAMAPGALESLRGRSGVLRAATVSIDGSEAQASLSGPVSVDAQGVIDANFELKLRQPAEIARILTALFPESAREIALSAAGIAAMGNEMSLPLRISRGEVTLGFFTLGVIPPL